MSAALDYASRVEAEAFDHFAERGLDETEAARRAEQAWLCALGVALAAEGVSVPVMPTAPRVERVALH